MGTDICKLSLEGRIRSVKPSAGRPGEERKAVLPRQRRPGTRAAAGRRAAGATTGRVESGFNVARGHERFFRIVRATLVLTSASVLWSRIRAVASRTSFMAIRTPHDSSSRHSAHVIYAVWLTHDTAASG